MKEDKLIIKDEIFRILIINIYITDSILHLVNHNLIHFYKFAQTETQLEQNWCASPPSSIAHYGWWKLVILKIIELELSIS